jgi:hypothetical protein
MSPPVQEGSWSVMGTRDGDSGLIYAGTDQLTTATAMVAAVWDCHGHPAADEVLSLKMHHTIAPAPAPASAAATCAAATSLQAVSSDMEAAPMQHLQDPFSLFYSAWRWCPALARLT